MLLRQPSLSCSSSVRLFRFRLAPNPSRLANINASTSTNINNINANPASLRQLHSSLPRMTVHNIRTYVRCCVVVGRMNPGLD